jgi:hypothetical protein
MRRRWIIRGFFMGLFAVCAAVWAASYFQRFFVNYRSGADVFAIRANNGLLLVCHDNQNGQDNEQTLVPVRDYQVLYPNTKHHWGGFAYETQLLRTGGVRWFVLVPIWFIATLLGISLGFAWRKTRPKGNSKTAFPVESNASKPTGSV